MHALTHPGQENRPAFGLRLLLIVAVASLLLIVPAIPPPAHVELPGVPRQALADNGITFLRPHGTPEVSEEEARLIATTEAPTFDLPISETVLVHMVDPNAGPPIDQLVWVNRIDLTKQTSSVMASALFPSAGNYKGEGEPIRVERTYHLIFIDADTGEYIYAISG